MLTPLLVHSPNPLPCKKLKSFNFVRLQSPEEVAIFISLAEFVQRAASPQIASLP
jgi:hypothetical protein